MRHGSLFSGIGGFDLAAKWCGWQNIFQVEIDPFCQKILQRHFPETQKFKDVKTFDASRFKGKIDILTGGAPCQPFSQAGKRRGTEDNRYLWDSMFRIIQEIKPRWIVAENVRGLLTWNNSLAFESICTDLENEGYQVQAFLLPACAVGTQHRRDRLWLVAHSNRFGQRKANLYTKIHNANSEKNSHDFPQFRYQHRGMRNIVLSEEHETRVCGIFNGVPTGVDRQRVKALGNPVVPQLVYQIYRSIISYENSQDSFANTVSPAQ